ncbi:hypothetical protein [Lactococcus lactis]|uniref:hypothetical protein n=1 Tax=Lactococcus lactis TaxID=1358 RepID=UPI0020175EA4|nr:hypothetical protein [Lactococcus lactis]
MKFKTFDLRAYRSNDGTLLSFDIKGGRIPRILYIKKGKPFKMKISQAIAERYRIKQEIKQTEYKGKSPEGLYPLTEVIEEKVTSWEYHNIKKENWQDWMRILVGADTEVLADLLTDNVERLIKVLGLTGLSIITNDKQESEENTLKAQIQELYSLNDSMFKDDINEVPRFTDGTEITAKDLADMNINALDNIAELIGFELEE